MASRRGPCATTPCERSSVSRRVTRSLAGHQDNLPDLQGVRVEPGVQLENCVERDFKAEGDVQQGIARDDGVLDWRKLGRSRSRSGWLGGRGRFRRGRGLGCGGGGGGRRRRGCRPGSAGGLRRGGACGRGCGRGRGTDGLGAALALGRGAAPGTAPGTTPARARRSNHGRPIPRGLRARAAPAVGRGQDRRSQERAYHPPRAMRPSGLSRW